MTVCDEQSDVLQSDYYKLLSNKCFLQPSNVKWDTGNQFWFDWLHHRNSSLNMARVRDCSCSTELHQEFTGRNVTVYRAHKSITDVSQLII